MIYCVLGPTASGKSDLAEIISVNKNCPLINFDAFQVYKELDVGTAKPSLELINSGRYFMYGFCPVNVEYDVMKYQEDARKLLDKFKDQDVVLVGGTGLYLKALLYDYKFLEEEKMDEHFKENETNEELYNELLKIDENDALKIGINNRKRLLRALHIYKIHGKSKTELNDNGKNTLLYKDVTFIGINPDRELLYERINKRVDIMFEKGLVNEVKDLFSKFDPSLRAFQAIGYKEFNQFNNLDDIKEAIKKNTRNYAKRQMTFFKHQFDNVNWFNSIEEARKFVEGL